MERRDVLKTAGGIGAAAIGGGAGVTALSGSAAAEASLGTFEISDSSLTTEDGTIDAFTVSPNVTVQYDGIDTDVGLVEVEFGVVYGGSTEALDSKQFTEVGTHADNLMWDAGALDVLSTSYEASDFTDSTENGEPAETEVTWYVHVDFQDSGYNDIVVPDDAGNNVSNGNIYKEFTTVVEVNNEQSDTQSGVDGTTSKSGPNQDPDPEDDEN